MSLLITSAIPEELSPLAATLDAKKTAYGWEKENIVLLPLGIGPIQAVSSLLQWKKPIKQVLFVGTAGFFDADLHRIGDLVQAQSVTLFDGAAVLKAAHFAALQTSPTLYAEENPTDLKKVKVANSLAVTSSTSLAHKVQSQTHCDVENLELYGVAFGAKQLNVPWTAILGLTNQVGPQGQEQWRSSHPQLSQKISQHLVTILSLSSLPPTRSNEQPSIM